MDKDFAVRCPLVRRSRLLSGSCPSARTFAPRFLQTPPRGDSPCALLTLHLHQVGWRTFTSKLLSMPGTQRSRYRGIEACCRTGSPLASRSVADTLGMNRPMQSDKRSSNTISKHPQSSMATFPNSVARVWPLWLEQASNVKVVVGDLFATPNLLKSHTERNLLSPYSNIRAVTSKLCACPSLAIVADHWS